MTLLAILLLALSAEAKTLAVTPNGLLRSIPGGDPGGKPR